MARDTAQGLKSLLLVMVVVGSVLSVVTMPALAAAGNVTITSGPHTVDETGDTVTVTYDVTADSAGLSNATASIAVLNSSGSAVYTDSQTVSVAANSTETMNYTFDAEAAGVAPGDYTIDINVDGVSATSNLTVTDVQTRNLDIAEFGTPKHTLGVDSSMGIDVTNVGEVNVTNVTLITTIEDGSGNVIYETRTGPQAVDMGATTSFTPVIPAGTFNETGAGEYSITHQVEYSDGTLGESQSGTIQVSEPSAGGAGGSLDGVTDNQLLIGALVLVFLGLVVAAAKAD